MKMTKLLTPFVLQDNEKGILYINKLPLQIKTLNLDFDKILKNQTPHEICILVKEILDVLRGITASGFLPTTDLRKFPIIRAFLYYILSEKENENRSADFINGKKSSITYRWIYTILMTNLYTLLELLLIKMKQEGENELDLYIDIETLTLKLYDSLEPSIRKILKKKGISIQQTINNSLDTEYKNIDQKTNKILSVQMCINTTSTLLINKSYSWELSDVNALSNESYNLIISQNIDKVVIESCINRLVELVRLSKYGDNDEKISKIIMGLKRSTDINYIEKTETIKFIFPFTSTISYFEDLRNKNISVKRIVEISKLLGYDSLNISYNKILGMLEFLSNTSSEGLMVEEKQKYDFENLIKHIRKTSEDSKILTEKDIEKYIVDNNNNNNRNKALKQKSVSRTSTSKLTTQRTFISRKICVALISHYNAADLSLMSDFAEFNKNIDIVKKGFVTLKGPIKYADTLLILRDTMLLSPAGFTSLSKIGSVYNLDKLLLTNDEITNMDVLLEENPTKYMNYAIRDSLIGLCHISWIEMFYFSKGGSGIPITLTGIGKQAVNQQWDLDGYNGYHVSEEPIIGDATRLQTPVGLNSIGYEKIGLDLSLFLKSYKGGRNESFSYGIDNELQVYDLDLTGAYTTIMSSIGHPYYNEARYITKSDLDKMSDTDKINSYLMIECNFKFPSNILFPSIPVVVDKTTTVYPYEGERVLLTGSEYILAKRQLCELEIIKIYYIPFYSYKNVEDNKIVTVKPFESIITEIQSKRRLYAKGTMSNVMYKQIGNSIYGSTATGLNYKTVYDNRTKEMVRIEPNKFTNPLIASWVTGNIRALVGEGLQAVQDNKGSAISVTTDGFITNLNNLEDLMLRDKNNVLLLNFKTLRESLSGDNTAFEYKSSGKGIISWTTRGQLGIESKIIATTGFQNKIFTDKKELVNLIVDGINSNEKTIEYIQKSLRSASDISKKGGHVTQTYKEIQFLLKHDNRRKFNTVLNQMVDKKDVIKIDSEIQNNSEIINQELLLTKSYKESELYKESTGLEYTIPFVNKDECINYRSISKRNRLKDYNSLTSHVSPLLKISTGRKHTSLAVVHFVKMLLSDKPQFSGMMGVFTNYNDIVNYIHAFDNSVKISKQSISNLRNRKIIQKQIPKNEDTLRFVEYIKIKFPDFREEFFFNA